MPRSPFKMGQRGCCRRASTSRTNRASSNRCSGFLDARNAFARRGLLVQTNVASLLEYNSFKRGSKRAELLMVSAHLSGKPRIRPSRRMRGRWTGRRPRFDLSLCELRSGTSGQAIPDRSRRRLRTISTATRLRQRARGHRPLPSGRPTRKSTRQVAPIGPD